MSSETLSLSRDRVTSTAIADSMPKTVHPSMYTSNSDEVTWIGMLNCVTYSPIISKEPSEAFLTMLASEEVLKRDWDQPEEEESNVIILDAVDAEIFADALLNPPDISDSLEKAKKKHAQLIINR